jgi:hypothetical protein
MVVACALLAACAPTVSNPSVGTADDFVRTDGIDFTLGNHPFRFVGVNIYDAAAAGEGYYTCAGPAGRYSAAELGSALAYLRRHAGVTVLRFWAYQTYTRSGTDWSGVDEVLALAKDNGMRVIPVLEDGPGYCTTGPEAVAKYEVDGDTWYETGYRIPYGTATLSYATYVRDVVHHYRNDPTILGWEMMNEATTTARVDGQSAVVPFARSIGAEIHAADPNHLVTVGTESDGWPGASGPDFTAVYSLPEVDFGVAHDYQAPGQSGDYDRYPMNGLSRTGTLPAPTSSECAATEGAPLACSVAEDLRLGKPMVIDEVAVGARSSDRRALEARAKLFDAKLAAGFSNGVSGELVWDFNKVDVTTAGNFDVEQYDHDPLIGVLHRWSGLVSGSGATRPATI